MPFHHKYKKSLTGITAGLLLIIGGTWGQIQGTAKTEISEPGLNELFNQVLYHVKNEYVEETSAQKLWFGAIKGMLESLGDAHTRFMTPAEYNELQVETRGNFGGLGIEISMRDGALTVVSPIPGTPAMRAGVQPGDRVIEINKQTTKNMSLTKAVKLLRGTPGTSVNLTVVREGEEELLYFDIVREVIKIKVAQSKFIEDKKLGYIKLKQFSQSSPRDLKKMLLDFKAKKAKGVIVDLRWNPGGLLDAAHKISNLFIKEGVIVSTRGRKKQLDRTFPAIPRNAIAPNLPIVVLANEGSASASEIVTGAIKDHKRGKFVGTKTFGKGSVQNVIPLMYKTAIALTIQKYYTPNGISIHKKGIKPDVEVKSLEFSKNDRRRIRIITEKKLLTEIGKKYKRYNSESVKAYKRLLKKQNLELSDFAARFTLKRHLNRNKATPLFDLEFDVQLKKAISLLSK